MFFVGGILVLIAPSMKSGVCIDRIFDAAWLMLSKSQSNDRVVLILKLYPDSFRGDL